MHPTEWLKWKMAVTIGFSGAVMFSYLLIYYATLFSYEVPSLHYSHMNFANIDAALDVLSNNKMLAIEEFGYWLLVSGQFKLMLFIAFFIPMTLGYIVYELHKRKEKFMMIPTNFQLGVPIRERGENFFVLDYFVKMDGESPIFANIRRMDISNYRNERENLEQHLGFEFQLERVGEKAMKLKYINLPKMVPFKMEDLKKEHIYFGEATNGKFYKHFSELTHTLVLGQSGAGKSSWANGYISSVLFNLKDIKHIFFVDFKEVEFAAYEQCARSTLVTNVSELKPMLHQLHNEMYARLKRMRKKGIKLSNEKPVFIIVDEFSTMFDCGDSKVQKEIDRLIGDISEKARATKLYLLFFGQKSATMMPTRVLNNLQTKIAMRTSDKDNILTAAGLQEELQELGIKVNDLPAGRILFTDGKTSEKTQIQTPLCETVDFKALKCRKRKKASEDRNATSGSGDAMRNEQVPEALEHR